MAQNWKDGLGKCVCGGLALALVLMLGGCLEERVIRDNRLDTKFSGNMSPSSIERAGQAGGNAWR